MAQHKNSTPTTPTPETLLPPLLACLVPHTALSPQPPQQIQPLLTPILRQRLHYHTANSTAGSWLSLLNWSADLGAKLARAVEESNLSPHPVSGEVEFTVDKVEFRRLDRETLNCRVLLDELNLLATYLWCVATEDNGGTGWRLAELRCLDDRDDARWFASVSAAEDGFTHSNAGSNSSSKYLSAQKQPEPSHDSDDDDDGSYWAAYDITPGPTPAKRSPAPRSLNSSTPAPQVSSTSELQYFGRYAVEVQPAMDPYDPDEDPNNRGDFTLPERDDAPTTNGTSAKVKDPTELVISVPESPIAPHPSSQESSPRSVERLEEKARERAQAEFGIKTHISTDIKSLYRLARSAGISREEFDRIVKTELEVLPLMDME